MSSEEPTERVEYQRSRNTSAVVKVAIVKSESIQQMFLCYKLSSPFSMSLLAQLVYSIVTSVIHTKLNMSLEKNELQHKLVPVEIYKPHFKNIRNGVQLEPDSKFRYHKKAVKNATFVVSAKSVRLFSNI